MCDDGMRIDDYGFCLPSMDLPNEMGQAETNLRIMTILELSCCFNLCFINTHTHKREGVKLELANGLTRWVLGWAKKIWIKNRL